MRRHRLVAGLAVMLGLALLLGARVASAGISFVFPPPPLGFPAAKSYSELAANWWKWVLAQPQASSPLLDTTGGNCAAGQSGAVWYLAGAPSNTPVLRTCTVPFGKTIVFPIVNAAYFAFPTDPPEQRTEAFIRSQVTFVEQAKNLRAEIDGIPVALPKLYLEKSKIFSITLPADNILGQVAGQVLDPSVDEGHYIGVQPLTVGPHKIHFHAELPGTPQSPGTVQEVTYNLTVW